VYIGIWWEIQKERDHYEDLGVGKKKILKRNLEEQDGVVWARIVWFKSGISGVLL
jgi:hypothetical protein